MNKTTILTLAAMAVLSGCGKQTETKEASAVDVPPVFVLQPIDGTPVPIPEARTQFKAGEKVILTGLIMGVPHPFVEGRAVFVLGDEGSLVPCDMKGDDHCPAPWDNCCDPGDVKAAGTVTVQVLGDDGKPLRTGLKGVNGLAELSRVTVAGTVAPNSSPEAFIINADAIHIGVR